MNINFYLTLDEKVKEYSHYTGVFNLFSFNGAINRNYNFDTWLANFAILKSTGYNTTTPCEHIDNCTTTLEVIYLLNIIKFKIIN